MADCFYCEEPLNLHHCWSAYPRIRLPLKLWNELAELPTKKAYHSDANLVFDLFNDRSAIFHPLPCYSRTSSWLHLQHHPIWQVWGHWQLSHIQNLHIYRSISFWQIIHLFWKRCPSERSTDRRLSFWKNNLQNNFPLTGYPSWRSSDGRKYFCQKDILKEDQLTEEIPSVSRLIFLESNERRIFSI